MTKRFTAMVALGFLFVGLAAKTADSSTASASLGVSAMVQASCAASPHSLTFRSYAAALANAVSSVSVICTNPTPYSLSLSKDPPDSSDIRVFTLNESVLAARSQSLQSGIWLRLRSPRANAAAPTGVIELDGGNRSNMVDSTTVYPSTVTVTIVY